MTEPTTDRRTGAAAISAGVLLFVSVAAEILWPVQSADGVLTNTAGFVLYLVAWTAGAAALTGALIGLRPAGMSRAGVVGRWISVAGTALLAAFGAVALTTALATGVPAGISFLFFAAGLLLLVIGAVPLALGVRRTGVLGGWWVAVLVAGAAAAVALVAEDPWHDLALFTFDAAWFSLGLRLLTAVRRTAVPA